LKALFVALMLWGLPFTTGVYAACLLDLPIQIPLGTYDPGGSVPSPIGWRLRLATSDGCSARIQVEGLDAEGILSLQGTDGQSLRVVMAQDAGATRHLPAAPQDLSSVQLNSGQQLNTQLWAIRAAGQWLSPGTYRGKLRITLLDASGWVMLRRDITFVTEVAATVQSSWGGVSSASGLTAARLDFGELVQGAIRSASLVVRANTGYGMFVESAHHGRLIHQKQPDVAIAYAITLNDRPFDQAHGIEQMFMTGLGAVRHVFSFRIGAVERVLAGDYVDSLLVTIRAQ
jgi:hypothetical protein